MLYQFTLLYSHSWSGSFFVVPQWILARHLHYIHPVKKLEVPVKYPGKIIWKAAEHTSNNWDGYNRCRATVFCIDRNYRVGLNKFLIFLIYIHWRPIIKSYLEHEFWYGQPYWRAILDVAPKDIIIGTLMNLFVHVSQNYDNWVLLKNKYFVYCW